MILYITVDLFGFEQDRSEPQFVYSLSCLLGFDADLGPSSLGQMCILQIGRENRFDTGLIETSGQSNKGNLILKRSKLIFNSLMAHYNDLN